MTVTSAEQDETYFARREECRESQHNWNYRAPITGVIPQFNGPKRDKVYEHAETFF